jgi:predicted SprT family Zn-dependent metalloprotease
MMTEREVTRLANFYLNQAGLTGWKIAFSNAAGRGGSCSYKTKTLRFSRLYMKASTEAGTRNTITHEVAHAIAGSGHGHDAVWKRIHKSMGGTGQTTVAESQVNMRVIEAKKNNYVICNKCHKFLGKSTRKIKTVGRIHAGCGGTPVNVHRSLAEVALKAQGVTV